MIKELFFKYYWVVVVVLLFVYGKFVRVDRPVVEGIKDFDVVIALFVGLWGYCLSYDSYIKNVSPKVQGIPFFSSLGVPPYLFKEGATSWFLFRLGGAKSTYYSPKGSKGACVCPSSWCTQQHESFSVHAICFKKPLKELPIQAQNVIEDLGLPPPYFLAVCPDTSGVGIVPTDVSDVQSELRRVISDQKAVIQDKFSVIRTFNADASNTSQSFNKPVRSLLNPFGGSGKNE